MEEEKKLTYWEKSVWINFNPSWMLLVGEIKQKFAEIIDILDELDVLKDHKKFFK